MGVDGDWLQEGWQLRFVACCAQWKSDSPPAGGGSGDGSSNMQVGPAVLEVWLRYFFSFDCRRVDGSGRGDDGNPQSPRLVRSSFSAVFQSELRRTPLPLSSRRIGFGGCSPVSQLLNPMAEGRPISNFLHAQRWQQGRQFSFFSATTLSSSPRWWRWRCGGFTTPSGHVPAVAKLAPWCGCMDSIVI